MTPGRGGPGVIYTEGVASMQEHEDTRATDVAWAAGLFEGEGCFAVYQRKTAGKFETQCRLAMTDEDVVRRFAAVIGVGSVRGPIIDGRVNHKPRWEWCCYSRSDCMAVASALLPFLGSRRAAKAREIIATGPARPKNENTNCPQGHPLSGDNLQLDWITGKNGKRYRARRCKSCRRAQGRERARKRLGTKPENFRV